MNTLKKISVAIDGPAAAGKSTVAKQVAQRCSYIYIDTGAMYRALTYRALNEQVLLDDEQALANLLLTMDIKLETTEEGQYVLVDGKNVTEEIRTNEVTNHVSLVARHGSVREHMVKRQQQMAIGGGVVMDGRDIGTHVLPNAEVKVFLVASVEERAKRRYQENLQKGFATDIEKLKEEIALRDRLDSEREMAPLTKAKDAIEIDTTAMTIEQVINKIIRLIEERV